MEDILNDLNIETVLAGDILTCEPPAWRQDIETEADIAEEVLRMVGYEHIPSTLMPRETMAGFRSDKQKFISRARRELVGMGLYEILTTPSSAALAGASGHPLADWRLNPVQLRNPLGEDTSVMRTTLVPSMLNTLEGNLHRGVAEAKLFELSNAFEPRAKGELPEEPPHALRGHVRPGRGLLHRQGDRHLAGGGFGVDCKAEEGARVYYHPGRRAVLAHDNERFARLGEIHPDVAARFDIDGRMYVLEVDLTALMAMAKPIYGVKELPRFPAVSRDTPLSSRKRRGAGDMLDCIEKGRRQDAGRGAPVRRLRGEKLGEGKKSVAYALTFRAGDRTLTDAEIQASMDKILKALETNFGAEIRR